MTTLADIARSHGVTPQAVGKWRNLAITKYGDLPYEQIGRRKQYTPDAVARILEFAPSQPTQETATETRSSESSAPPISVEIYEGDDVTTVHTPPLPASINLAQFRREGFINIDLSDTQAAIALTQHLSQAMEADIAQRWQQLQTTQQVAKDLEKATQTLDQQAMAYRVESGILAKLQASENQSVQALLAKVQALGKSQTDASTGNST